MWHPFSHLTTHPRTRTDDRTDGRRTDSNAWPPPPPLSSKKVGIIRLELVSVTRVGYVTTPIVIQPLLHICFDTKSDGRATVSRHGDFSRPVARRLFATGREETFCYRGRGDLLRLVDYNVRIVRIVYCVRKGDKRFISLYWECKPWISVTRHFIRRPNIKTNRFINSLFLLCCAWCLCVDILVIDTNTITFISNNCTLTKLCI